MKFESPSPSIFRFVRRSAEILTALTVVAFSANAELVVHFDFENPSETAPHILNRAPNASGNNAGTLINTAAFSTNTPSQPTASASSLSLNGVDDSVSVANQVPLINDVSGFTLAAFVKISAFPEAGDNWANVVFVSTSGRATQARAILQVGPDGQFATGGRNVDSGTIGRYSSESALLEANTWYHLAATVDKSSEPVVTLYLNGAEVENVFESGIEFTTGKFPATGNAAVRIGSNGAGKGEFWYGLIDDVRIYNEALSQSQIQALAAGEPPTAP